MNPPAPGTPPTDAVEVMAVIDGARFSPFQWRVVALCLLVGLIDGFENGVIAYVAPALLGDFGLSLPAMGNIFAAGTVGMAIGCLTMGGLADRWGRKTAVVASVAVFGVAALGTAASTGLVELMLWRFMAGIAIGGAQPVMIALLAEYAPLRHRSTATVVGFVGVGIGVPISALLSAWIIPRHGWEAVFIIGGVVPLLLLPGLWWALPESIRFLVSSGGRNGARVAASLNRIVGQALYSASDQFVLTEPPAQRASGRELLTPRYRRRTLAIWAVYFFNWITWYLFLLWLPTALTQAGLDLTRASQIGALMGVTALLAFPPAAVVIQRLGPARCMAWLFAGGTITAVLLALAGTRWELIAALVVPFTVFGVIPQVALNYLCVELYPTPIRATGVGWAIAAGRVGSVLGALVGGGLIAQWGLSGYFTTLAAPLLLAGVLTLLCFGRPGHRGSG